MPDITIVILLLNGFGMLALLVAAVKVVSALEKVLVALGEVKRLLKTANDNVAPLVRAANLIKARTTSQLGGAETVVESPSPPASSINVSDLVGVIKVGKGIVDVVKKRKRK